VWASVVRDGVARALYKTFYRRVRDRELAEDLLDRCLAELSLDRTYNPGAVGLSAFRVWVHACVHHHLCAYYKSRQRERAYLGQPVPPIELDDGEAAALGIESRLDVATMLMFLPEREREIVSRWSNGETARETAQALGLTEVHVRQLTFRSLRNLRKQFGTTAIASFSRLSHDS